MLDLSIESLTLIAAQDWNVLCARRDVRDLGRPAGAALAVPEGRAPTTSSLVEAAELAVAGPA
jgi:hypothetical protein